MKLLRNILTMVVVLATLAAGVLFALQNKSPVPLDMLVYTFEPQSLALWVLGAFAIGGVLGMLVSSAILVRTRATLNSSKRQLEKARAELSRLRSEAPALEAS
jgi:putative membrane protein